MNLPTPHPITVGRQWWPWRARIRALIGGVMLALLCALLPTSAPAFGAPPPGNTGPADDVDRIELRPPVPGRLLRPFDPPEHVGAAGHRGVDLEAEPGQPVVAAADGVVSHVGVIAGVPTVTITHRTTTRLRTTYQPVIAMVATGQRVSAGQLIGHLGTRPVDQADHAGLHWGLLRGEDYLDPWLWVVNASNGPVRLLPLGSTPRPPPPASLGPGLPEQYPGSTRPADGPITSPFGMRLHPILKTWRFHDGVDLGAPCGASVRSIAAGRVVTVEHHRAYGTRIIVEHESGLRSGYAHLSGVRVGVGDRVSPGERIGDVGSTGWSTGCHLHFMVWRQGRIADPTGLVT